MSSSAPSIPCSKFLSNIFHRLKSLFPCDPFTFIVNGTPFATDIFDAVAISPAVYERLCDDMSNTDFTISDDEIDTTHFTYLLALLSGEDFMLNKSMRRPLISLCRQLQNPELEQFFFSLWPFGSSPPEDVHVSLRDVFLHNPRSVSASNFGMHSADDIALLEIETLHAVLSSDSLKLESEDWLLRLLLFDLGPQYASLLDYVRYEYLSSEGIALFLDQISFCDVTDAIWNSLALRMKGYHDPLVEERRYMNSSPNFSSQILSDLPPLFSDLAGKRFILLWRGSRDGFGRADFHGRCDGRGNTLTIILDSSGFVFGGFTPQPWDSSNKWKSDDSLKSFIFSLKNPHNVQPRKFALKSDQKHRAIYCGSGYGPIFGEANDIGVTDKCNESGQSFSGGFGDTYTNDTGLSGRTFFTGSPNFTVAEIEVFEISD
jgi:hypothetical protein